MPRVIKNKKSSRQAQKSVVGCFARAACKGGFSFVEVIISIFIIVVGIVATVTLLGKSMKESLDSRDQVIAGLLAQESIELVRNIRDNNWVATGAVSFDHITDGDNCRIDKDYSYPDPVSCGNSFVNLLLKTDGNGFYSYSGSGTNTKYHRKLMIEDINAGAEKKVTSMVIWSGSSTSVFPAVTDCNTAEKCAYTEVTLTKWGE